MGYGIIMIGYIVSWYLVYSFHIHTDYVIPWIPLDQKSQEILLINIPLLVAGIIGMAFSHFMDWQDKKENRK